MNEEDLINRMLDFCEENWSAFISRCEESGYTEDDIEEVIDGMCSKPE